MKGQDWGIAFYDTLSGLRCYFIWLMSRRSSGGETVDDYRTVNKELAAYNPEPGYAAAIGCRNQDRCPG